MIINIKTFQSSAAISVCTLFLLGCSPSVDLEQGANKDGHTAPTAATIESNKAVLEKRPFQNRSDFDNATKGLIAKEDSLIIKHQTTNQNVWNMPAYDFINIEAEKAPSSVNPSLWRQAQLNNIHGLFKVTDGIFQLRGFDLANMSIIESQNGWIIVDPLTADETAERALLFAQKHLGKKPIKAILFTHSHIDHFGGVAGILKHLSAEEKKTLKIVAPAGFEEEATSENIIAGVAMSRRAMYMYGKRLARNERGHVGTGLGKEPAFGTFGFEEATDLIEASDSKLTIDGVPFVFQTVSGSEAPAEFTFYLPDHKAFCGAELVSRNMHNLYTLRGAKVRDGKLWSAYIDEARQRFSDAQVYFASHHWPLWGKENINDFLVKQRDTYKFIHDQSVRLLNQGYTPNEIAESLSMPATLNEDFHNQGYYGTLKHNAKAVYQAYLGWYHANPAKLDPLPEQEAASRYIQMMGGSDQVVIKAQQQFEQASTSHYEDAHKTYRWLAELLNQVIFAEPNNTEAKGLLAKIYDQLGYQSESGPWRDVYLSAAYELRHSAPEVGMSPAIMKNVLLKTPIPKFFDSMSVRLNAAKAEGAQYKIKITFTDLSKSYLLTVNNSLLHHKEVSAETKADATLNLTHPLFVDMAVGVAGIKDTLFSDDLTIDGSKLDLVRFFAMFDKPKGRFNIVTP